MDLDSGDLYIIWNNISVGEKEQNKKIKASVWPLASIRLNTQNYEKTTKTILF
jgi:hypothetical protein